MSTQTFSERMCLFAAIVLFALLLGGSAFVGALPTAARSLPGPTNSLPASAYPVPKSTSQVKPLSPGPDLIIESITLNPAQPELDQEFEVTVKIKNQGDAAVTTPFHVYLYVDPVDQPPNANTPDTTWWGWGVGLAPGASQGFTRMGETFTTEGWHILYGWVDKENTVDEDDENNNVGHITYCLGDGFCPDRYESDNSCETAKPIATDGFPQIHNLFPVEDQDWVRFEAMSGVTYVIESLNVGADADTVLSLVGKCGEPPGLGGGQRIEWTAPVSGTFYLKMEHHDRTYNPEQSEYSVSISEQDDCSADAYEMDNTCSAARDLTTTGDTQRHLFCRQEDVDWVKFSATAGVTYTIQAQDVGVDADVMLSLHNQCGVPGSFGSGQRIEWLCPIDGTYYVKAENHDPNKYGPAASYDLSIHSGASCVPDRFEMDDSAASAKRITVDGAAQARTFCPAADQDWARFQAVHGTTYTIETSNLGPESDTFVALYGTDGGTLIAWDDDSGPGRGSRITWQCPADGTYTIKVRHHNPQAAGAGTRYDLAVTTAACQPDGYEEDDSHAAASAIPTNGAPQNHNFCGAGDVDWVQFSARAGVNYVIKTSDLGPSCDTVLHLYAPDGTTQLGTNDDYGPGQASRIDFRPSSGGTYYVMARHYNGTTHGTGTEFKMSVKEGTEPPPTPTPTVTPPPAVTPPPSGIKTLILVNRERVQHYHGGSAAAPLMAKLDELARHDLVQGTVVQVESNGAVAKAYRAWNGDPLNTAKANAVTGAVRNLILSYLKGNDSIEYIVLVGDDRIIPFRRTPDHTTPLESKYGHVSEQTTVGAASRDNMILTDDYYADREPISWHGHEVYLPDLAVGRLIETPADITGLIDEFVSNNGQTDLNRALVTGYSFVGDAALKMCDLLQQDAGSSEVDCTLIGNSWTGGDLRDRQLGAGARFEVQSINGHASHWAEGAPRGSGVTAEDVLRAQKDLGGVLIYTMGCHAGLNVPPNNITHTLDLAEAFLRKRANYVANTGYGWGMKNAVGLSERLMINLTRELLTDRSASLGQSLTSAKQSYYRQTARFTDHDEKILIESTLYGLPMYQLNTSVALGDDDPFAKDVTFHPGAYTAPPGGDLAMDTAFFTLNNSFAAMPLEPDPDGFGSYYTLSGYTSNGPLQATQPLYFHKLAPPLGHQVRGLILTQASYTQTTGFDPVIGVAENEYHTSAIEPDYDAVGWRPAVPAHLLRPNLSSPEATLLFSLGQYNAKGQTERLYDGAALDVYSSSSADHAPPSILWVDGIRVDAQGRAYIKVETSDSSGIERVNVAYTDGMERWESQDLAYDSDAQKWIGSFPATEDTGCFVQVVDRAGNVAADTNKGSYYRFAPGELPRYDILLPIVMHRP